MIVYLDNSATTRQYDSVTEKMLRYLKDDFGNPSSLHTMGQSAEKALKESRKSIAEALGFDAQDVYFTSGGTEADNLALLGISSARRRRGNRIITSRVEHPAVLECCKKLSDIGFEVVYIGVDEKCRLDLDELRESIDENTVLISVMHVNNEVGTILPLAEIFEEKGKAAFHTDAVQSFGKMSLAAIRADIVTVSAHKIHGPKGCGVIAVRKGVNIEPHFFGGGQERSLRSGTENVPAIAAFGEAVEIACTHLEERVRKMDGVRKYLLDGIKAEIKDIKINSVEKTSMDGAAGFCSPSILNASFLGTRGEVILHGLESEGIYVSTGAACSSNKKGKSHALAAMGLSDKEIESALRFSFSEFNTISEADYVVYKLKDKVNKYRRVGSYR